MDASVALLGLSYSETLSSGSPMLLMAGRNYSLAASALASYAMLVRTMIFVHFDGDDIGSVLELLLLDNNVESARNYSASVARAMALVHTTLVNRHQETDVFVSGGDDLVVRFPDGAITMQEVEQLRQVFYKTCGRTMSVGIGISPSEASQNLRRAKLMGKNATVSPAIVAGPDFNVET